MTQRSSQHNSAPGNNNSHHSLKITNDHSYLQPSLRRPSSSNFRCSVTKLWLIFVYTLSVTISCMIGMHHMAVNLAFLCTSDGTDSGKDQPQQKLSARRTFPGPLRAGNQLRAVEVAGASRENTTPASAAEDITPVIKTMKGSEMITKAKSNVMVTNQQPNSPLEIHLIKDQNALQPFEHLKLTCGCPETCDQNALRHSNGYHRCETRIKFLMDQYHVTEHEACRSAASWEYHAGYPSCDTRCLPGLCEGPKKKTDENEEEASIGKETLDGTTKSSSNPWILTCGCPETCDQKALRFSNGYHRCETRIKYLMNHYHITEHEACQSASSLELHAGNPPCDTRCSPGLCELPRKEITDDEEWDATPKETSDGTTGSIDCGCPETCDEEGLAANNGYHVCAERILYLMHRYHDTEATACQAASSGENPPCDSACQPGVCVKPRKHEESNK